MKNDLDILRDLIHRLKDAGIEVACVGGAARDTILGVPPKDYDLAVLRYPEGSTDTDLWAMLGTAFGRPVTQMPAEALNEYFEGALQRGVVHVFEGDLPESMQKINVQVIVFNESTTALYKGDPYMLVEDHDCSLNMAWMEDINGRLVARAHPEFPSPFTGNINRFNPGMSTDGRRAYIQAKYPGFNHQ